MDTRMPDPRATPGRHDAPADRTPLVHYASAAIVCIATTAIAAPLSRELDLANVVMLYPLAVLLIAFRLGRAPAVLAAFLNVALFDFFLVPPYYSFAVSDVQYLLTFAVMLVVALVTGHLAADLRLQVESAARRERRTQALYEMARDLGRAATIGQIDGTVRAFAGKTLGTQAVMLFFDAQGEVEMLSRPGESWPIDREMVRIAGSGEGFTDMDHSHPVRYQAMKGADAVHGVLAFLATGEGMAALAEHGDLLEAVASLAATAIERVRYAEAACGTEREPSALRLRRAYASLLAREIEAAVKMLEHAGTALREAEAENLLPERWRALPATLRQHVAQLQSAVEAGTGP